MKSIHDCKLEAIGNGPDHDYKGSFWIRKIQTVYSVKFLI